MTSLFFVHSCLPSREIQGVVEDQLNSIRSFHRKFGYTEVSKIDYQINKIIEEHGIHAFMKSIDTIQNIYDLNLSEM